MRKRLLPLFLLLLSVPAVAQGDRADDVKRLQDAAGILNDIMAAPDSAIPADIFHSAKCVAVVPSLLKGGIGLGGAYGKGVATCRTEKGWSSPAFFSIRGGSFGLQLGAQAVDLIMMVMNDQGMRALLSSKVKLGVDASAAAGPVGRHAAGSTDLKLNAQVLTYSRARGLFAGLTLNGAMIAQHKDDTRDYYGRNVSFRSILTGEVPAPADAEPFLKTVREYADQAPPPSPPPAPAGETKPQQETPPPAQAPRGVSPE